MLFQFTFSLPYSLRNPFASGDTQSTDSVDPILEVPQSRELTRRPSRPRLSPSPGLGIEPSESFLSQKRGWEPSYPTSVSSTAVVTTGGYLDTPAKYREITMREDCDQIVDAMIDDLRPAKKRRTVTESIVSTAFSAALISTAVGLTVYRMWRDRGKSSNPQTQTPPPPYDEQWATPVPNPSTPVSSPSATTESVPRKTIRKYRSVNAIRRTRKPRQVNSGHGSTSSASTHSQPIHKTIPQDVQDHAGDSDGEIDRYMDRIGAQLAALIEQGRRALNSEVVVMSEVKEDEVDDGTGHWVEEPEAGPSSLPVSSSFPVPPSKSIRKRSSTVSLDHSKSRVRYPPSKSTPPSPSKRPRTPGTHPRDSPFRKGLGLLPGPETAQDVQVLFESESRDFNTGLDNDVLEPRERKRSSIWMGL